MAIKQISIFIENKEGRIKKAISILGEKDINIRALSIADTTKYGIDIYGESKLAELLEKLSKIEGINFVEAVQTLAERANIQLPTFENHADAAREELKAKVYKVNEFTAQYYHENLYKPTAKIAQEYVKKRKLSNDILKSFRIGFSGKFDELYQALKKEGFQDPEILESGLVNRNDNGRYIDRYRNRLMFPICDARGRVIAFGGRVLDDSKPKYINSPENIVFSKGRNLFGLNVAKKSKDIKKRLLIVEGYMDVISLHQRGISNVVAPLRNSFNSTTRLAT